MCLYRKSNRCIFKMIKDKMKTGVTIINTVDISTSILNNKNRKKINLKQNEKHNSNQGVKVTIAKLGKCKKKRGRGQIGMKSMNLKG